MLNAAWDTAWEKLTLWFPERHVYLRSGDHAQTFVISRRHQILAAFAALVVVGWALSATLGLAAMAWSESNRETNLARLTAYYERLNADRQARLQMAVGELGRTGGSIESMAHDIERRHAALAWLLQGASGKAGGGPSLASLKPVDPAALPGASAGERIAAVREDQERLLSQAESLLKSRADRLRTALRLAGLDSQRFSGRASQGQGQGGPLIDGKDPRALGAVLDVDPAFAERIQHVAADMTDLRSLSSATEALPLATPVNSAVGTSTYGVRLDPFTHQTAFHAGQDFGGQIGSPIFSTAPGVVAFTGVRTGYGNVVEVDHGSGFKTRYAHLASISVRVGDHVGVGQRVGAMGSTGRSTGPHLHYEIWENGRVRDPTRFLKAGQDVQ